jgi:NitT/TauT family transport system substrate-binding protein/putative hydroxymethylpyrimidine transport system substrate-binding protein
VNQYRRGVRSLVALLASFACLVGLQACGGAEPDAPRQRGASLTLDFRPNAVHTGIYAAAGSGGLGRNGIDLEILQPGSSADAGKILGAGETEFAILDIADLALARSNGIPLTAVAAVVQKPLAAVIAGPGKTGRPQADLAGGTIGVTGAASDELVLDTVLQAEGLSSADITRINIGFGSVPALSAGRLDAATAFWNAEGVELKRSGVPTRELRVERYGAPDYPQLLIAVNQQKIEPDSPLVCSLLRGLSAGYRLTARSPRSSLGYLLNANPALDRASQAAQLDALIEGSALSESISVNAKRVGDWIDWATEGGLLDRKQAASAHGMIPPRGNRCDQPR